MGQSLTRSGIPMKTLEHCRHSAASSIGWSETPSFRPMGETLGRDGSSRQPGSIAEAEP
jgi:hypothetical protein